jgi:hypothetical protein
MSFKLNTLKLLLNPLTTFLTKIEALIGIDLPISNNTSNNKISTSDEDALLLPVEKRNTLKNQSFVKSDKIKEVLENSQQLCLEAVPELREYLKVIIIYNCFMTYNCYLYYLSSTYNYFIVIIPIYCNIL